jgi:hypothetical protein
MTTQLAKLAVDLDRARRTLSNLYSLTSRLEQQGRLGSAARTPDELARALACVNAAANSVSREAFDHIVEGTPR